MISKEFRLDLEALCSQILGGQGYLHYGYWKDGKADEVSLHSLGIAQQAYFDQLVAAIPEGIDSILDVGSGTGSNALGFLQEGYSVDCVCPSPRLNEIARKKLPQGTQILECAFEDLVTNNRYDLLLFSESFHYLDAKRAFYQIATYARKYALVFDYFPRKDSDTHRKISYSQFTQLISDSFSDTLCVVRDQDMTKFITPTFVVLDEIRNNYVRPFIIRSVTDFMNEHRVYSFLLSYPLRRLLASCAKPSNRSKSFSEAYEYRLILLAKTPQVHSVDRARPQP